MARVRSDGDNAANYASAAGARALSPSPLLPVDFETLRLAPSDSYPPFYRSRPWDVSSNPLTDTNLVAYDSR